MNLQQLEYVLALAEHRHFGRAAEACFVTQPTLSMMVVKLEEELGLRLFDRSKKPVQPTREGELVIAHAREILAGAESLRALAGEIRGEVRGELHLGIIPTLAPYLLPLFLQAFTEQHPHLKVFIKEMVTSDILLKLKDGQLDVGLLATPLHEEGLEEFPLFYEEFFAYSSEPARPGKKLILPADIHLNKLWLLEEGHCMRNQVFDLCELKKKDLESDRLHYEAGSIETLINLVDNSAGITIVPYLATLLLKPEQKKKLRPFADPKPVREVSLVAVEGFPRKKLLNSLLKQISATVPRGMRSLSNKRITRAASLSY